MDDNLQSVIENLIDYCYSDQEDLAREEIQRLIDILASTTDLDERALVLFDQINKALEAGDYVTIADYCEFGLKPMLDEQSVSETVFYPYNEIRPLVDEKYYYLAPFIDGEPVLCVNKNGKVQNLNSLYSPTNEADYILNHLKLKRYVPIVCLFGIGTGILAEKLLDNLSEDSKLLICEPEKELIEYCEEAGTGLNSSPEEKKIKDRLKRIKEDPRSVIYIENDTEATFQRVLEFMIDYTTLAGMVHVIHNGYKTVFFDSCLNFYKQLKDFRIRLLTNKNTEFYFKEAYVRSSFSNIRFCRKVNLVSELGKIVPKDIPAIIVSAGPSLNKNIEILRKVKGHFFIVAVDRAVHNLLDRNIFPDVTITVDAEKPPEFFDHPLIKTVPCLFASNANTELLEKTEGRKFLLDGRGEYLELLFNYMNIKTAQMQRFGGGVATAAFAVLVSLGMKNIVLVGQDLAYSGGSTHADGVNDGGEDEKTFVEGIDGNPVATRRDWVSFLKWFETSIEDIGKSRDDINIIDATEGGAKIHGTTIMTLEEVIEHFRKPDGSLPIFEFEKEAQKLDYLFDEKGYEELCDKHKNMIRKIKDIENDSYEAFKLCGDLIKNIKDGNASDKYIHKQNRIIKDLRKKIEKSPMFFIINRYAHNFTLHESTRLELEDGDNKTIQVNLVEALKLHFDSFVQVSKQIYNIAKEYEKDL